MKINYKSTFVLLFMLLSFGSYSQTTCAPVTYTSCPGFRTQTQGGWGSTPSGNNQGTYLSNNFAGAFPNGLTVGCIRKIQFNSSAAVRAFLPQGGTAGVLPIGTTVNPTKTSMSNVLAGQLVTLALNMGFDSYDANFGSSNYNLKDLRIATGPFMGMTVEEFYNEGSKRIGNCYTGSFTFAQFNTAATAINENYDNGTTHGNYLSCPLVVSSRIGNLTCNNDGTGTISITITNAVGTYSILWSTGATTSSITGLQAGTYTVTITDALGSVTKSYTVTQPAPYVLTTSGVNLKCYDGTDGNANVNVTGNTPPYSYVWSNGAVTAASYNLTAGTYTVTVTDSKGCQSNSSSVTLTQPSLMVVTNSQTNVSCNGGNNGSASLNIIGGTTPYTILWSTGENTSSINNLLAGQYEFNVTDANGCNGSGSNDMITITQPTALAIRSNTTNNVSCNGGSNGAVSVSIGGGVSPYTYSWSNGGSTSSISNLTAGNYSLTVTDNNNCTLQSSYSVSEPTQLNLSINSSNVLCYGGNTGSASGVANGGTAPYTYAWSTGATTSSISNLRIGTFTLTVTDANGCSATSSVTITQPIALAGTTSSVKVSCFGGNDGTATINTTGGTTPYSYLWSNGGTSATTTGAAGTYTVTVTDANGCKITRSRCISQPTAIAASFTKTNVSCNGGSNGTATVNPTGGTAPYTYSWSNGATTKTISGLVAGTYTVTITDNKGCVKVCSTAITQPSALYATLTSTNVSCFGGNDGSITTNNGGGTTPYTYSWSNGASTSNINNLAAGNYTLTITDANGCTISKSKRICQPTAPLTANSNKSNVTCNGGNNGSASVTAAGGTAPYTYLWSNGAITSSTNNLSAGSYTVTVTDSKGCQTSLTIVISQPSALSASTSVTNVLCNGGNGLVIVSANGGTAPYSGTGSFTVAAGTYNYTVTDANGCTASTSATVTEPSLLTASSTATNALCNGSNGAINVTANGGTTPYSGTGSYSVAAGTYNYTVTDANGCTASTSANVTEPTLLIASSTATNALCNGSNGAINLTANGGTAPYTGTGSYSVAAGTYNYTVTDANGCTATTSATVTEPTLLTASSTATNALCNGSNGSIDVTANGGTTPYVGTGSYSVAAGTYNYTVTDANGCTATTSATVTEPSLLTASSTATNALCNGSNGSINVTANGGTAPYSGTGSYSVAAGTYNYTVTDANGCTASTSATVTQPSPLIASTITADAICYGQNGTVTVNANGGTTPYTGTGVFVVAAGSYEYVVTDANGCETSTSATVNQPTLLIVNVTTTDDLNSTCTGTATVSYSGGVAPYNVLWSNGFSSNTISNLCATSYTVTVTCSNGCSASRTATINNTITSCDPLKTYTQGGWGSTPNGNNPGVYLHNNFSAAFPNGLTIGCTNTLTLTSASAVTGWLPSGTTASYLPTGNMVDNITYNNVLAAQLAAAVLNVGFDAYDANFASSGDLLGSRYLTISGFEGMTVNQVISEANQAIGGCGLGSHTLPELNMALTTINENYDNGNTDQGHLSCTPTTSQCRTKAVIKSNSTVSSMYPVPCNDKLNVVINGQEGENYMVSIRDLSGRLISQENVSMENSIQSVVLNTLDISAQMVVVSITGKDFVESHKVLVQH